MFLLLYEKWGSGLRRVNRVLAEYGIRPVVINEATFATQVNVYRNTAITLKHEGNEGNREGNEGNREDNSADNEDNIEDNEDNIEDNEDNAQAIDLILAKLKFNPHVSVRQLASELPISKATVERALHKLQTAGRIRRKGGTRGVWEVLE